MHAHALNTQSMAQRIKEDLTINRNDFWVTTTNISHTLKKSPLKYENLKEFVELYNPKNRHEREETWSEASADTSTPLSGRGRGSGGRWRKYSYEEILARDKTSLDIFWLRDDSMIDLDNLPEPDVLAAEIVENIEAALESFKTISEKLEA